MGVKYRTIKRVISVKIPTILAALFSLCLLGCGGEYTILDQAESVIYNHPDSAYTLLSTTHLDEIGSEEERARYALLHSMALDYKGVSLRSDSLTNVALDWYKDNGSEYQRASAYLYSAMVYYRWNDTPEAVEMLTYAQEIAPRDSIYLQCMIAKYMGHLYSNQFDYKSAANRFHRGFDLAVELDDKPTQADISMELYEQYAGQSRYDIAESHIQRGRDIYYELLDSANMLKSECILTRCRVRNGENPAKAREDYLRERSKFNHPICSEEHIKLAELYDKDNMVDSALYHMNQATQRTPKTLKDKISLHKIVAQMYAMRGRYKEAHSTLTKVNKYQDRFYKENLNIATDRLAERYKGELYKERSQSLESEKRGVIVLSISLISLLLSLTYILIRRYKNRLRILDERLGVAGDLAQAITNSQAMISSDDDDSFGNINLIMSRLNDLIEKMPKYESDPHGFINEFVTLMRREKITQNDSRTIFSQIIDREYNGVLSILESRYNLDSNEIEILSMVALGVSNSAMRIILDHTNNRTIYNLRSSIKSKLNISIDSHSILELLHNESCDNDMNL